MKKIYVFDMGHVILKPTNLKSMYMEACVDCDYQYFKNLFYNSRESIWVYGGFIDDDTFFRILRDKTGSKITVDELKELYLKNKGGVYEDTINIIRKLKKENNIVCLLSNLKVIDYEYLSSVVDMNMFDKVFLSYIMHMVKPENKIYEEVIKELGTNDFYFFDDTPINVQNAKGLGIDAFNVTGDDIKNCFEKRLILENN